MASSAVVDRAEQRMLAAGVPAPAIAAFRRHRDRLRAGRPAFLPSAELQPVVMPPRLQDLPPADGLDDLAVVKLNGGLGTSMGLQGPKSLVEVRPGTTFLDAVLEQTAGLPLLLMSSAQTEAATTAALRERRAEARQFLQSQEPKLDPDTLEPVSWPADEALEWCPPGHGEVYAALGWSGVLDELLERGVRYAFLSNVDNLGAVPDPRVLRWMREQHAPFVMEVVEGTEADRKGGHLALHRGSLVLRETAQVGPEDGASFRDVGRWRFYNTNNLWVDLQRLRGLLRAARGALDLPLIVNHKTVDPRDPSSPPVVQLESAMGAAVGVIPGSRVLQVPRDRFAPVKTTDDLLVLRSDVYELRHGVPVPQAPVPFVELDREHFALVDQLAARFPHGAPSLRACRSLRVRGSVTFGRDVRCIGDVVVDADVPDGAVLGG